VFLLIEKLAEAWYGDGYKEALKNVQRKKNRTLKRRTNKGYK
jgi:hypothetical protein